MPKTFEFNVDQLIRELEATTQRDYEKQDIAAAAGISRTTLFNITENRTRRVDLDTLFRIYDYLRAEGLDERQLSLFRERQPATNGR